jgi:hypothetical protein
MHMDALAQVYNDMGFIRYPLTFSTLAVVGIALWSSMRLYRAEAVADPRTKAWVDAVLFWGGFALVTGVLGTLLGVIIAAQSIEAAGEVAPVLVWGGIKVALLSSVAGALVLALSGLAWFGLQLRWRSLQARDG